jgi:hypothetical protein
MMAAETGETAETGPGGLARQAAAAIVALPCAAADVKKME